MTRFAALALGGWIVAMGVGCASSGGEAPPAETREPTRPAVAERPEPQPEPAAPETTETPPPRETQVHASPPDVPAPLANQRPDWWIDQPEVVDGRVRIAVAAEADTMLDARRSAVASGEDALREHLAKEPTDLRVELIHLVRLTAGQYRAYVLVSAGS